MKVTGLEEKSVVNIYDTATSGKLLVKATVAAKKTEVLLKIPKAKLLGDGGKIYVTVTTPTTRESLATEVTYDEEPESTPTSASAIIAINNTGSDLVVAYGLKPGDIVKIYDATIHGNLLCTSIKVWAKQSEVIMTVKQLGAAGGDIYVTVTGVGFKESSRTKIAFAAE